MIEWAHPLWFLALVPALLVPWLARNPRLAVGSIAAIKSRHTLRTVFAWLPRLLGSLGLVCLVLALARPQEIHRQRILEREGIDIMLVLDTSGSMEARDFALRGRQVNRLTAAKDVISRFVEGRPDDRIGLVVFGDDAFTQVPLTTDAQAMVAFLRQVELGVAGKQTAIGDAIAVAANRLKELEAPSRVMILLTDGQNTAGQVEPMQAAKAAAALGIRIYTVGIGGSGGGGGGLFGLLSASRNELDERSLQAIARLTGGRYFRASDTDSLAGVYQTIDQLEKTTAEVKEFVDAEERFEPFLVAGMVLLLMQLLLGETVLRRLP